jgi:hypothetical protein
VLRRLRLGRTFPGKHWLEKAVCMVEAKAAQPRRIPKSWRDHLRPVRFMVPKRVHRMVEVLHDRRALASISTVLEKANSLGVEGGEPGFRRR